MPVKAWINAEIICERRRCDTLDAGPSGLIAVNKSNPPWRAGYWLPVLRTRCRRWRNKTKPSIGTA